MGALSRPTPKELSQLVKKLGLSEARPMARKKSKYGNRMTYIDGRRFHSKREAERYVALKLQVDAGLIADLKMQVRFPLHASTRDGGIVEQVSIYIADFTYLEIVARDGHRHCHARFTVEDVKGAKTAMYMLKKKMMKVCHNIEVLET